MKEMLKVFSKDVHFTFNGDIYLQADEVAINSPVGQNIIATVYRKVTNSDIYFHWNLLCPQSWKQGTLKSLVQRALLNFSTEDVLKIELNHI